MTANNRIRTGVVGVCTVAACIATAAVLAQPRPRAFDTLGGPEAPGWGGVAEGSTLFMRAVGPVTMTARNAAGVMVKAASLPHNVHVVQGIGSKTLLLIDHEQWGRSTIELDVPATAEAWLEIKFDEVGRAHVNMLNQNQLRASADAPPAQRVSLQGCGDCDLPHDTPGCTDPECEALVCAQDTFCCLVEWDPFCVNHALAKCDCDGGAFDCAACPEIAVVNDSQVGITMSGYQVCEGGFWTSVAFPIQTGGADVDTVLSVHNTNVGEGDIYIMGGTCDGPDVNNILWTCCCGIKDAPSGVEISNSSGFPIATSATDPTWVVMVFRGAGFSFDVAFDSSTLGTAGAAYGNLTGLGIPGDWQDLADYSFGACYFVDLALTGNPASECECPGPPEPPPNDDCVNAEVLDVGPAGTACIDGTTIGATVDPGECVVPTTAPGVWYRVTGTGNIMTATTCEDFPPAGADYDTKISVFCWDCPEPSSNCCLAHGGLGCDDAECESIVCAQDSFCCATAWDSICAGQALSKCDICAGVRQAVCVTGNDDNCGSESSHSTVTWCSAPGGEYFILVHGFGSSHGNFTLCVSDEGISCPWNEWCIEIPPGGACCQCDGSVQFCTWESEEDCLLLTGDPANFLGFGTSCATESEALILISTPGVEIPDDDLVGVTDSITVTDSVTITDLDVGVDIDHTWIGDLCVNISKDGGPPVELIKRMGLEAECDADSCCGCSADNMDVILDDSAAVSIEVPCDSPVGGMYYPDPGQLAAYNGMDAAGTWTLWVNDNAAGDVGVLAQWSLHFALPSGPPPCEVALPDKCIEGDDDDDDGPGDDDDDDGPGWWTD